MPHSFFRRLSWYPSRLSSEGDFLGILRESHKQYAMNFFFSLILRHFFLRPQSNGFSFFSREQSLTKQL
eukprot:m.951 g.951  ORF g.951 m.951 type:complete len:69 (+) comp1095_c0_seq2:17-223(+)